MGCINSKRSSSRVKLVNIDSSLSNTNFIRNKGSSIKDFYKFNKPIGQGTFAVVVTATHIQSGEPRAIKIIAKSKQAGVSERRLKEVEILRKLEHQNIVRLYEFFEDEDYYYLVNELCNGGELMDKILSQHALSEAIATKYMKQILSAVVYMHSQNIVHRDIKPENILFETNEPNSLLKLIDFGTSVLFETNRKLKRIKGTVILK
jgi:calcium-dependent protein kinase